MESKQGWIAVLVLSVILPVAAVAGPVHLNPIIATPTTPLDPNYAPASPGSFYNGVAALFVFTDNAVYGCSAALVDATQLLTAAHCVNPSSIDPTAGQTDFIAAIFPFVDPSSIPNGQNVFADFAPFVGAAGTEDDAAGWLANPSWTGNAYAGNDVGIVNLSYAMSGVTSYSIYTGSGSGSPATLAGFGVEGSGATGENANGTFGTFRLGQNEFEATNDSSFSTVSALTASSDVNALLYDFDNPNDSTGACNTLANVFGLPSSNGLPNESMTTSGDSGGPSFINGQLAAVHSANISFDPWVEPGCGTSTLTAGFGTLGLDDRLVGSANLSFIEGNTSANVPEPTSLVLLGVCLPLLAFAYRRASSCSSVWHK